MGDEVKLIGKSISAFSLRIEVALKLKGIHYEFIEEDLLNKSPLLLKLNPVHQKIPVLIHNGKSIVESLVILEYIEETWKNNPILPKDHYDRATARFWAKFIDEKIVALSRKYLLAKDEEIEEILKEISEHFKILENQLKRNELFGGDGIGYLDIVIFYIIYWYQTVQEVKQMDLFITKEKFPDLCNYMEKLKEIDVIKESITPKEKFLDYHRFVFEFVKNLPK
ncbi:probable glutathione S-transferase [Mercurialis annua]|uniref:probable glutathione S-transferase n=1 Tax=Mercurialis annua TaxID=3986 RepID=UPI00215F191D|nr:probable glutathione S-transferase [Mercurialis annua]